MDPYDDLLRGVRGEGSVFGATALSPPFALGFTSGHSMTLCAPLRGEGWLVRAGEARRVRAGESAVVRGPEPFVFADTPTPGAVTDLPSAGPGEVTGDTVLLAGTYRVNGEVARRLVRLLPPMLVVPDEHGCGGMRDYLEAQLLSGCPGRQVVLDRLLDWLLVCTLRDWFDRPEAARPAWYVALGDDVAGPALRAIHDDPSRPWTLASLAATANVSRTTFARRFTEIMGEPPLTYLTEWRMALAADMLAERASTVAAVARRVGYSDAFGFSAAFKRTRGMSPSAYRASAVPASH
ncbi:AraC family transcriptional regulator [Spongiactinospora sp. TRM90649]|uniref:AraC family transcriptional regulator n=1 Tax=Spongiactinospora sp. TRM90649 TaxID=3031114 RepID=UPI0023F86C36|nr:AraC family transcriptional regulator [Spongiactinospora sp. TRM90649]MDF5751553.1 AraC family transcriptional regulator [Spongiactinospora sp. TRM90649]